ncbi:MAG: hypothetical protein WD358_08635 [Nitriliruptoraceae bacterium]
MTLSSPAMGVAAALIAALGVHLVVTAVAFGWSGVGIGPRWLARDSGSWRGRLVRVVAPDGRLSAERLVGQLLVGFVAGVGGWAMFGTVLAAVLVGVLALWVLVAATRASHAAQLERSRDAWPRLIEEIRLTTVSLGRSIPWALLEVGRSAPVEMQPGFEAARREWAMSSDFEATLEVLTDRLADPTADVVAETLLVAYAVGGTDIDTQLRSLADDRIQDVQGRKDARARQAGVRFARWFVVLVPVGMALVGLSIGDGRDAYASATGQVGIGVALAMIGLCWWWASQLLKLPVEPRIFRRAERVRPLEGLRS